MAGMGNNRAFAEGRTAPITKPCISKKTITKTASGMHVAPRIFSGVSKSAKSGSEKGETRGDIIKVPANDISKEKQM